MSFNSAGKVTCIEPIRFCFVGGVKHPNFELLGCLDPTVQASISLQTAACCWLGVRDRGVTRLNISVLHFSMGHDGFKADAKCQCGHIFRNNKSVAHQE